MRLWSFGDRGLDLWCLRLVVERLRCVSALFLEKMMGDIQNWVIFLKGGTACLVPKARWKLCGGCHGHMVVLHLPICCTEV